MPIQVDGLFNVIGASAGLRHTAVWTQDQGQFFTFGDGRDGQLGHGRSRSSSSFHLRPKRVAALAYEKVVGGSAGLCQTAVWTEEGEIFTFGQGRFGALGHGNGQDDEWSDVHEPRLVMALVDA